MDDAGARTRERIWVTKFDHSTEPPTPVEEVFAEDGVVVERRDLTAPVAEDGEIIDGVERLEAIVSALEPGESVLVRVEASDSDPKYRSASEEASAAPKEEEEEHDGRTEAIRQRWE